MAIKIGAKIVSHSRYVVFQMAEVAIPRTLFGADRGTAAAARHLDSVRRSIVMRSLQTLGEVRPDDGKFGNFSVRLDFGTSLHSSQTCPRRSGLARNPERSQIDLQSAAICGHLENVG